MNPQAAAELASLPKNLHQLIGLIAGNSMPTAVQRNSFIVNEVPREFNIVTDEKILANILTRLVTTVVRNSKHSCIRIKAREYEDVIFVSIRDNSFGTYPKTGNLEEIQLLAKKMNGHVSVENSKDSFTTILLSFPNFPKAA